ncbi:hypothetical protein AVEN_265791-1 [Araneus ventricosus]|uniref:Uncharacterized protein n=1 Tax=Araneus ventricosus TaxID=182803 RepID=A0A4Y2MW39_ARAVE|nr:hypothetical protein AVEN_265791-1 [Araneus ventricosus]
MFHVVEFNKSSGGGLGIVREEWLTSRKKECFWPPFKHADKINKCLTSGQYITDDWTLFPIDRSSYSTGDVLKAREKLKAAESESELITEEEEYPLKRKRKLCKRFSFSSDEAFSDDNIDTSKNIYRLKVPKLSDVLIPPVHQEEASEVTYPLEAELHAVNTPVSVLPFGLLSEASHHTVSTPVGRPLGLLSKTSYQESDGRTTKNSCQSFILLFRKCVQD